MAFGRYSRADHGGAKAHRLAARKFHLLKQKRPLISVSQIFAFARFASGMECVEKFLKMQFQRLLRHLRRSEFPTWLCADREFFAKASGNSPPDCGVSLFQTLQEKPPLHPVSVGQIFLNRFPRALDAPQTALFAYKKPPPRDARKYIAFSMRCIEKRGDLW